MNKISVCMATYNGAAFIKQQILSILHQLGANDEMVISDDGSTDGTLEIIESFNDNRIRLLYHKPISNYRLKIINNMNLASINFINAIENATGDIIILSDQDDVWEPNKVSVVKACLDNEADLCLHNYSTIDSDNKLLGMSVRKQSPLRGNIYKFFLTLPFMGCCMAFKRSLKDIILPVPHKLVSHDQYIGLRAVKYGFNIKYIDTALIKRRIHTANASLYKQPTILEKIEYNYCLYKSIFLSVLVHK